jgi:hypothetical protein
MKTWAYTRGHGTTRRYFLRLRNVFHKRMLQKTNTTFLQANVYMHTVDQLACKWIANLHLLKQSRMSTFSRILKPTVADN